MRLRTQNSSVTFEPHIYQALCAWCMRADTHTRVESEKLRLVRHRTEFSRSDYVHTRYMMV